MPQPKKQPQGCGCANIPISVILIFLGFGWWWFSQQANQEKLAQIYTSFLPLYQQITSPFVSSNPTPTATPLLPVNPNTNNPSPSLPQNPSPRISSTPQNSASPSSLPTNPWEKKQIRGIYFSRYQITNNADEATIRQRVRYYRSQGFNTIIHGVWGNGCTMYRSEVMQKKFGIPSCPNQFQDKWLDWLIDEAHQQGMQVHAYFEKGIKIDHNSPIFNLAIARKWVVPGVDRTYAGIDHYVLDVEIPEVADFFQNISVEFVTKYPQIDAVQWDDYLGYHNDLPGKVDRTAKLTNFVQEMIRGIKTANPRVSFDICHHNPYWSKRYFAADWANWSFNRAFIQVYNDANFDAELNYAKQYAGVAITDQQFHRLNELINNPDIKSILVFPTDGKPEAAAAKLRGLIGK